MSINYYIYIILNKTYTIDLTCHTNTFNIIYPTTFNSHPN